MSGLHHKGEYPADWKRIADMVKAEAGWACVRCGHDHDPAAGRCLTVHHFDADKGNCARWNLMALCQACHLSVQARVDPRIPLLFEPSPWAFPYIAGVFAAGVCAPLPGYTLAAWVEKYQDQVGAWPAWAVKPDACWGVMR